MPETKFEDPFDNKLVEGVFGAKKIYGYNQEVECYVCGEKINGMAIFALTIQGKKVTGQLICPFCKPTWADPGFPVEVFAKTGAEEITYDFESNHWVLKWYRVEKDEKKT